MSGDREYFRRRAEAERENAKAARDAKAAALHLELAERYEALASEPQRASAS